LTATPIGGSDPLRNAPIRTFAFAMAALLVFFRFSMLSQVMTQVTGANLRLLYLITIPALLGLVLAGGIQRSYRGRPAYWYTAYMLWMIVDIPFSVWRGGSFTRTWEFMRTDAIMLFIIAGIAISWKECKILMGAVALGAVVNVLSARLFSGADHYGYRVALSFGSISDPNDYAAHLLLVLPFLLWVAMTRRNTVIRALAFGGVLFGIKLVLGTASRGALLALAAVMLFWLWRGTARQRVVILGLAPLVAIGMYLLLPPETRSRLMAFRETTGVETEQQREALESSKAREYVFQKSIEYMIHFPIFGVGPGQFSFYEGTHSTVLGSHGYWHETHNSFTSAGSECGIPGLIFFIGGILSTFLLLNKTYNEARRHPGCEDIQTAAFCMMMAFVGFVVAISFLSFAYFFYTPAMAGFSILLYPAAREEMQNRGLAGTAQLVPVR
jgi:O-antigen ligase